MKATRIKARVRAWCQRAAEAGYDAAARRGWINPSVCPSRHVQVVRVDREEFTVVPVTVELEWCGAWDDRALIDYAFNRARQLMAEKLKDRIAFDVIRAHHDFTRHKIIGRLDLAVRR